MDSKTLCLAALSMGDLSGYEIRKFFEEGFLSYFQGVSYGAIYPSLKKLLNDGLISERAATETDRADKKLYSITKEGISALTDGFLQPPAEDTFRSDVLTIFIYGHLIPAEVLERLYDQYIQFHRNELDHISSSACPSPDAGFHSPAETFITDMGVQIHELLLNYLLKNRDTFLQEMRVARANFKSIQSKEELSHE